MSQVGPKVERQEEGCRGHLGVGFLVSEMNRGWRDWKNWTLSHCIVGDEGVWKVHFSYLLFLKHGARM